MNASLQTPVGEGRTVALRGSPTPGHAGTSRRYVVFADDWGEHPSSCQHLFARIARTNDVLWVNTVGMRTPSPTLADARKAIRKLRRMAAGTAGSATPARGAATPGRLRVVQPPMLPFMRSGACRAFNRAMVRRALRAFVGTGEAPLTVVTTVPNAVDYLDVCEGAQTVYYCVDDFVRWPGHDAVLVQDMESRLVQRADILFAASPALERRLSGSGRTVHRLDHGVDLDRFALDGVEPHSCLAAIPAPRAGYFGLIDARVDFALVSRLALRFPQVSFVLAGPRVVDAGALRDRPNVHFVGALPYEALPSLLAGLDLLLLPYVVDALALSLSPLKLRECIASGKPVLSAAIPEAKRLEPFVRTVANDDEWAAGIASALARRWPVTPEAMRGSLSGQTWTARAEAFVARCTEDDRRPPARGSTTRAREVVLSFDFFPKIGGAHGLLYEIYRGWPEPVTVLTSAPTPGTREALDAAAFDRREHGALRIERGAFAIGDIDLASTRTWREYANVLRALASIAGPGLRTLHCLRAFPEGVAGLVWARDPRRGRRPLLVVYVHGEELLVARSSRQLRLLAWLVYRLADVVIANSRSTANDLSAFCPRARVVLSHPGVASADYARAALDAPAMRESWGWPARTRVVCTVARMEPRKNQAAVMHAIAALRAEGLPLAYVCAGDGEERDRLVALSSRLGLGHWIRFPGIVDEREKRAIFAAADVHAMPATRHGSMREGFGIVFLEAAAAGVPSVCGNDGGQAEAVLHGRTGLVVDGASPAAVTAALRTLVADDGLRERMGREGRAWAAQNDWSIVRARVRSLLSAE